jgi:hypothetical protein
MPAFTVAAEVRLALPDSALASSAPDSVSDAGYRLVRLVPGLVADLPGLGAVVHAIRATPP